MYTGIQFGVDALRIRITPHQGFCSFQTRQTTSRDQYLGAVADMPNITLTQAYAHLNHE